MEMQSHLPNLQKPQLEPPTSSGVTSGLVQIADSGSFCDGGIKDVHSDVSPESWICVFDVIWWMDKNTKLFLPQKGDDLVMAKESTSPSSSPPRPHKKKKTVAIETKQQPSQRLLVQNNYYIDNFWYLLMFMHSKTNNEICLWLTCFIEIPYINGSSGRSEGGGNGGKGGARGAAGGGGGNLRLRSHTLP